MIYIDSTMTSLKNKIKFAIRCGIPVTREVFLQTQGCKPFVLNNLRHFLIKEVEGQILGRSR